jgi:hypothetical protein
MQHIIHMTCRAQHPHEQTQSVEDIKMFNRTAGALLPDGCPVVVLQYRQYRAGPKGSQGGHLALSQGEGGEVREASRYRGGQQLQGAQHVKQVSPSAMQLLT